MQIPKQLPQFNTFSGLLAVISRQEAHFYRAYQGQIEKIKEVKTENIRYSDDEGMMRESGGPGQVYRSGAVKEISDKDQKKYLMRELKKYLPTLNKDYSSQEGRLYLFVPSHTITEVKELLPKKLKEILDMDFVGNYQNYHPTELLEKINQELEKKVSEAKNSN